MDDDGEHGSWKRICMDEVSEVREMLGSQGGEVGGSLAVDRDAKLDLRTLSLLSIHIMHTWPHR